MRNTRLMTKAAGRNMYITTRHISTKKLPRCESLLSARMIAVRAHKPTAAERKEHRDAKEDLREIRKGHISGVVLDVRIGDERDDRVEDCAGGKHPEAARIKRHPGLY